MAEWFCCTAFDWEPGRFCRCLGLEANIWHTVKHFYDCGTMWKTSQGLVLYYDPVNQMTGLTEIFAQVLYLIPVFGRVMLQTSHSTVFEKRSKSVQQSKTECFIASLTFGLLLTTFGQHYSP